MCAAGEAAVPPSGETFYDAPFRQLQLEANGLDVAERAPAKLNLLLQSPDVCQCSRGDDKPADRALETSERIIDNIHFALVPTATFCSLVEPINKIILAIIIK